MLTRHGTDQDEVALGGLLSGAVSPETLTPSQLEEAWERAAPASVDELLADLLCRARAGGIGGGADVGRFRERAATRLREAHAREMVRVDGLRAIIAALDAAGVRALLMKGAALAYTIYPAPHLRPSDDVDVLIAHESLAAADAALVGAGFQRQLEPDSTLASLQRHYVRPAGSAFEHIVDLHWAAANRHVFARLLEFEDVWARSQPMPLPGRARGLGTVDGLLLACVHRVAHHADHPCLIWLWDVHLLASRLTADLVDELGRRAEQSEVAAVVAHGLRQARQRFGTQVDPELLARLDRAVGEPSARFIGGVARPIDWLRSDLAAAGSFTRRLQLVREHLFPGLSYVGEKYAGWPRGLLPLAYLHRIARGAPAWLKSIANP